MKKLKRVTVITALLAVYLINVSGVDIKHIDPPFWYTDMKNSELQIMVYGKDISKAKVNINYPGIKVKEVAGTDSTIHMAVHI